MAQGGDERLQVVGLGMATLDVLVRLRDMPSWDRGSQISGFRLDGGGPVGTAMVAAARLGARVGLVGTAGNDQAAGLKMQSLIDSGVDLSRMVYRAAPEDQIVIVYVHTETGERVFAGVSPSERMPLRAEELDREYITAAEYLHLDGFHPEAALQAARWARQAGNTVVLDGHKTSGPIREHLRALVQHVDVLISGSGFLQGLTGVADTCQAGAMALDLGPKVIVQTEGEGGSYTVTAEGHFHVPAFSVDVVDTTGAGDVFHGAYIVGLLHGWDLEQTAWFSTAVAALKCTQLGGCSGIPCFDAVLEFLHQYGIHLEE